MHFEQDIKNAFGSVSAGIINFLPTLGSSLVAYIANHHCPGLTSPYLRSEKLLEEEPKFSGGDLRNRF